MAKQDITRSRDIELLVTSFYKRVAKAPVINHFFTDTSWDTHMQTMVRFWENALFYTGNYQGNPMEIHRHIHHIKKLDSIHFDTWLQLFEATVDDLFEGEVANLAKQKARNIATVMQIKILEMQQQSHY
jgi:hemoglobin